MNLFVIGGVFVIGFIVGRTTSDVNPFGSKSPPASDTLPIGPGAMMTSRIP